MHTQGDRLKECGPKQARNLGSQSSEHGSRWRLSEAGRVRWHEWAHAQAVLAGNLTSQAIALDAHRRGLTDEIVDEELAAYNAEGWDPPPGT